MKKMVLILLLHLASGYLYADYNGEITTKENDLLYSKVDNFDLISLVGFDFISQVGAPQLPLKTLRVIIPANKIVSSITINSYNEIELSGNFMIYPTQKHIYISDTISPFALPDTSIYNYSIFYPVDNFKLEGIGNMAGAKIFTISFCPLRYNPITKKIKLITNINYTLNYIDDSNYFYQPLKISDSYYDIICNRLNNLAINKNEISNYYNIPKSNFQNLCEHVILTTELLEPAFLNLARIMTQYGQPTIVYTKNSTNIPLTNLSPSEIRTF